jgi:hypothetical protein
MMTDTPRPSDAPPTPQRVRVIVRHTPTLFSILGWYPASECHEELVIGHHTYAKVHTGPRGVYYTRVVDGEHPHAVAPPPPPTTTP